MAEGFVSPVSGSTNRSYSDNLQRVETASRNQPVEASSSSAEPWLNKAASREVKTAGQAEYNKPANVQLQFKIDPETNDITVIVMDRNSEQVIRTIPPEELNNLVEGDLLEVLT